MADLEEAEEKTDIEEISEENEEDEFEQEGIEEKEGADLFKTATLEELRKDGTFKKNNALSKISDAFNPKEKQVHPGFMASYSFGEHEYEILKNILLRLTQVTEKVFSYRKDYLLYFPETYGLVKNFYICIKFIIDSENRNKIDDGLNYVRQRVIDFTQDNKLDVRAIVILEEIYSLLYQIKNFHNLGFSYEKKKSGKEKYFENLFKARKKE